MVLVGFSDKFGALMKRLMFAFIGSFLGAVWAAYAALSLGADMHIWVPLSVVGAFTACTLILAILQARRRFEGWNQPPKKDFWAFFRLFFSDYIPKDIQRCKY
jgi:hypothetical protein